MSTSSLPPALRARLDDLVASDRVVLFMKGSRTMPQCGFSATVVRVLDEHLDDYRTVDVLADPALREGIKAYSDWPTIPQLYVAGTFVGGSDIVRAMAESGELQTLLDGGTGGRAAPTPPRVALKPAAAKAFREALADAGTDVLRFAASPRFEHELFFAPPAPNDLVVDCDGIRLHVDRASAKRVDGTVIDFVEGPQGAGFKIENPNEPAKVKQLTAVELKAMRDRGEAFELVDVRTEGERAVAKIEGSVLLDEATRERLEALDRATPIVLYCHHGHRSQAAAEAFRQKGFKNLYNLQGGIDAWSTSVDAGVARY